VFNIFCLLCKASITSQQEDKVIVPSKHVGAIDPDLAGDVSQEDTTDDSKGSDIDDDGQESEGNAYDPQSGSSDADDLGEDDQNNESTKDADDPEESTKDADDPASKARADRAAAVANCNRVTKEAAEREATRTEFNPDKLEDVDTPELAALRLTPRRYPPRTTAKVPLLTGSSSSVNDKDVVNKGAFYQTVIYISTLHFHFTFQL
jgi:hypothetical protein